MMPLRDTRDGRRHPLSPSCYLYSIHSVLKITHKRMLAGKQSIFKAFWDVRRTKNGPQQAQNGPKILVLVSHVV